MGIEMPMSITLGNLTVDRARFEASIDGRRADLTYVEFELLYTLARNAGRAVSRDRLSAAIWREPADGTRRVTVHISRLRKKLEGALGDQDDHQAGLHPHTNDGGGGGTTPAAPPPSGGRRGSAVSAGVLLEAARLLLVPYGRLREGDTNGYKPP